jgi:hypothetical protein
LANPSAFGQRLCVAKGTDIFNMLRAEESPIEELHFLLQKSAPRLCECNPYLQNKFACPISHPN